MRDLIQEIHSHIGGTMKDQLRIAVAYWHSFSSEGGDLFGPDTRDLPWNRNTDLSQAVKGRLDAAFEFMSKLGVPYYCFHDRDLVKIKQKESGIRLLW